MSEAGTLSPPSRGVVAGARMNRRTAYPSRSTEPAGAPDIERHTALVKKIAERHGGGVEIVSKKGEGLHLVVHL